MPLYPFYCTQHGQFDVFKHMQDDSWDITCPGCLKPAMRVWTAPASSTAQKERLRFGTGSPGRIIPSRDTGGLDILIPSMGAMEQEEVDYIALGAIEKEKERVKKRKGPRNEMQAKIQAYTDLARHTKAGQRAKTIREAIKESGDKIVTRG